MCTHIEAYTHLNGMVAKVEFFNKQYSTPGYGQESHYKIQRLKARDVAQW
jgi:hypothetical protein